MEEMTRMFGRPFLHQQPVRIVFLTSLCIVFLAVPLLAQYTWSPADTVNYSDSTTAATVILARARHYHRDSIIRNYSAVVTTRLDAGIGRRTFGFIQPFVAAETVSRVSWQYPDQLRVEIIGQRGTSALSGVDDITMGFDRPWFVARSIGDSISLLEGGFPENSALHPLAEGAEEFYRYSIVDSVTISIPGLTIRAIDIRIEPKKDGPALVAGDMWVDADTYEVVRLSILFVGYSLWVDLEDEAEFDSDRVNNMVNRILTAQADLEYALYDSKYWLPFRQLVTLTVEIPWILNVKIPVRFLTEFTDYEINTVPPIAFTIPLEDLRVLEENDSTGWRWRRRVQCPECGDDGPLRSRRREAGYTRAGGDGNKRWEIVTPDLKTLGSYQWDHEIRLGLEPDDEVRVREILAQLAHIAEGLDASMVGRTNSAVAWETLADVVRFNRVQGWSFGIGYMFRPGPAFTTVYASGRMGLGDLRPMGQLAWRRDAPEGSFEFRGFREIGEHEPWSGGQSLGNSINATFASHDDADYFLRLGAGVSFEKYSRRLHEINVKISYERHRSMITESGAIFGGLRSNPGVLEGDFLKGTVEQRWRFLLGSSTSGVEVMAGEGLKSARFWTALQLTLPKILQSVITAKLGGTVGDNIPQLAYRVGGPRTVRGHPYGERAGESFWSVQLDVPLRHGTALAPVVFFDMGSTFGRPDPLLGVGFGWSLFNGWLRPNLSYALAPDRGLRFDILFGAPR